ncbi:MAG: phage tail protein [Cyanobacteria bacterium J06634_6]
MATGDFSELLLASRFYLRLELQVSGGTQSVDAVFSECQRFQRSQKAIEVIEVTPRQWGKAKYGQLVSTKVPGRVATDNLVLKRGLTESVTLWNWFTAVESGDWVNQEAEGGLSIYDQAGDEKARYDFRGAWPMRYSTSGVNARSTDMAIEELVLAIDSFTRAA